MAAVSSNSLPNPHVPTFLPAQSSGRVIPESAQDTSSVPDRWNGWAMLMMSAPSSRDTSALGTQAKPNSTAPDASTCWGTMSTAPSRISTLRPSSS